ncbi:uncharacterized protein LOC119506931 [Choloepus didactylus]|uniref:uncharacterized protein LOC119506931 n=1 Tax=Choloepus didactylus TaxID=27675 RepID=UPI00189D182B|nr:uncharacterized protein LOC119506931 [Choloepus didactylus]
MDLGIREKHSVASQPSSLLVSSCARAPRHSLPESQAIPTGVCGQSVSLPGCSLAVRSFVLTVSSYHADMTPAGIAQLRDGMCWMQAKNRTLTFTLPPPAQALVPPVLSPGIQSSRCSLTPLPRPWSPVLGGMERALPGVTGSGPTWSRGGKYLCRRAAFRPHLISKIPRLHFFIGLMALGTQKQLLESEPSGYMLRSKIMSGKFYTSTGLLRGDWCSNKLIRFYSHCGASFHMEGKEKETNRA